MSRTRYLIPLIMLAGAIIVGCKPNAPSPAAEKAIEAKVARLETDLKKSNEEIAKMSAQIRLDEVKIKELEKERTDLQAALKDRLSERDLALGKLESFRKSVKELLGQMDAAIANPYKPLPEPVTILPPPALPHVQ